MSQATNPFARGYQDLRIVRTLFITYADDCLPVWRPLHASQAHLPDDQVELFPCLIGDHFALITEGQSVPTELENQCASEGVVRAVVHAVVGNDADGQPCNVGDLYSAQAAQEVVQRLGFETGVYSRCWEISSAHITEEASGYLAQLADLATPEGFLFVAFRISCSPAIGMKLIATPWTDANLRDVQGITAEQLRQEFRDKGMPESLANVLELAGQADVRMLVLDADARVLEGLPVFDDGS